MNATIKAAKAAGRLMGIARQEPKGDVPKEACRSCSERPRRVGGHCSTSVSFLRRTYQQTRLVLTQHNLAVPDSDEECSCSELESDQEAKEEEEEEGIEECGIKVEDREESLQLRPSASSTSRRATKMSAKVKETARKDVLWGKVKAMFEGTRLAMQQREKVRDQVRVAVQETVKRHNSTKRMQEAFRNAVDVNSLLAMGVDPSVADEFRSIMEDAATYQTLEHLMFARNLLETVLGEEAEARDQAYLLLQDSLLDACQESAEGSHERELELESLMWSILSRVDDLKDDVARAREMRLQEAEVALAAQANSSAECRCRSPQEERIEQGAPPTQPLQASAPARVLSPPPPLPPPPPSETASVMEQDDNVGTQGESDHCDATVASPMHTAGSEVQEQPQRIQEPQRARRDPPLKDATTRSGGSARAHEMAAVPKPKRHISAPVPHRIPQVRTDTSLPGMPDEESTQSKHAATMDSFFQESPLEIPYADMFCKRRVATSNEPMVVIGQGPLPPLARALRRDGGGSKQRFPVMPMFPVCEAKRSSKQRPDTSESRPDQSLVEGKLQSSWSFSKTAGSGRFDYALSPLPVSRIVRVTPSKSRPKILRQTPPSTASSVTDWFPLPSMVEDEF